MFNSQDKIRLIRHRDISLFCKLLSANVYVTGKSSLESKNMYSDKLIYTVAATKESVAKITRKIVANWYNVQQVYLIIF